ncbi:hypothetical protein HDU87_008674 [Geranomyces variabilis]|uniref:protein-tyrosine-phosphatase n=1 Tax=Geranomyces variabilis TaxID=109894 RepID=A0AAD5TCR3_9FUNG|nr:hypothetical protein HDU87_008674 [Geranomyces variabilis]
MRELPKSVSYAKDTQTNPAAALAGKVSFHPPAAPQQQHLTAQKRLASAGSSDDLDLATKGPVQKRVASQEELEHLNAGGAQQLHSHLPQRQVQQAQAQAQQHQRQQQQEQEPEQPQGREVVMTDAEGLRISTAGGAADEGADDSEQQPVVGAVATAFAGLKLARGGGGGGANSGSNSAAGTPLELGLGTPRSGSPAVAAPTLGELIECGVATVTPSALLSALRAQQRERAGDSRMDVDELAEEDEDYEDASPFSTDARILPVDLRYVADFARRRIVGSANVNLPMLMLKRFRRGAVSSFQISNFLTCPASKELFDEWLSGDGENDAERVIIVYDDEMDEDATDTEAWAMVTILAKELADDVYTPSGRRSPPGSSSSRDTTPTAAALSLPTRRPPTRVAYLRGGFHAFQNAPGAAEFLEQEQSDLGGQRAEVEDSMQLPELALKKLPEGGNREPGTPLAAQVVAPIGGSAGSGGFQIRTSQLKAEPIPGAGIGSPTTAGPPTASDSGTPTIGRLIAGAGAGAGQRKKSAFSINTTKLAPQSRARGNTLNAGLNPIGPPRRLTMQYGAAGGGGGTVSAGISGMLPRQVPGRDSGSRGPTTAYPSNGPKPQLPDVRETSARVAHPVASVAVPQTPISQSRPELPRRRSISEPPASASETADSQQQQHSAQHIPLSPDQQQQHQQQQQFFQQLSPGPSTLPTPVEPVSVILPHLLLGSDALPQAKDAVEQLQELGVTHVLNMAVEVENKLVDESGKFDVKWCLAEDHAEHDIEPAIREAVDWIAEAHAANPSNIVFVHCKAGRSRSATTVIAYLVVHHGMRLRDAYETVKQARPGVSPNLGFMLALLRIEKEVHGEDAHTDKGVYP